MSLQIIKILFVACLALMPFVHANFITISVSPNFLESGDGVRLCAVLNKDAKQFSITFASDDENNIEYHFTYNLEKNIIIDNYKENGKWMKGTKTVVPSDKTIVQPNIYRHKKNDRDSMAFYLSFEFHDNGIDVSSSNRETSEDIHEFEKDDINFSNIKKILISGEVKYLQDFDLFKGPTQ